MSTPLRLSSAIGNRERPGNSVVFELRHRWVHPNCQQPIAAECRRTRPNESLATIFALPTKLASRSTASLLWSIIGKSPERRVPLYELPTIRTNITLRLRRVMYSLGKSGFSECLRTAFPNDRPSMPSVPRIPGFLDASDTSTCGGPRSVQEWRGRELRGMSLHRRMLMGNPNA